MRVGLVPQHLADIFLTPRADNTAEKIPSRCITGVRVLTSNEMMREKDRKGKEAAEMKQRRKEEREQRRVEKEQQRERKRKEREDKKKQGEGCRTKGKGRKHAHHSSSEDEPHEDESHFQSTSRCTRLVRARDRYRGDSPAESEESDTVCIVCKEREPPIASSMVFWVDCDQCGEWAHTHCALGSNTVSRQFICESCCQQNC